MSDWWLRHQVEKFAFDFDAADKDKNGALSCDEVVAVLRTVGFEGTDDEAKEIFAHLDLNNDQRITKDEFKDAIWRLPNYSIQEFTIRVAFKNMDKDKSGYVTKHEVLAYFAENKGCNIEKEKIDKILEYLEVKDDDSQVHYDEFLRLMNFEESGSVMYQIFSRIDKDGSGVLSVEEMKEALKAQGQLRKFRSKIENLLDTHARECPDKKIDFHQFVAIWLKKK